MNWYKTGKSYEVRKPVNIPDRPAENWISFEEQGFYWGHEFELVPINKIRHEVWNQSRFESALEGLREGKQLPAVKLSYDEDQDIYEISDGNHRVAASKEMGYDEVPAIVGKRIYEAPSRPLEDDIWVEVMSTEGLRVLQQLRSFGYSEFNNFDIAYDKTFSYGYRFLISHTGEWEEEPLMISRNGEDRVANMNFEGETFESRGNIEQIVGDLRVFLGKFFI